MRRSWQSEIEIPSSQRKLPDRHKPASVDVTRHKLLPICVVQLGARFDFTEMLVVESALGMVQVQAGN